LAAAFWAWNATSGFRNRLADKEAQELIENAVGFFRMLHNWKRREMRDQGHGGFEND